MPEQYSSHNNFSRRRLWWLVATPLLLLLLLGSVNFVASEILAGQVERWARERGLEVRIDHLRVSVFSLRLVARGVDLKNSEGRGARVRELMLDYRWRDLLKRRLRLQEVELEGVHFDLESSAGDEGRQWEVAGVPLGGGGEGDGGEVDEGREEREERERREFELLLENVRLRDSSLCYRHRPAWDQADCARFEELRLQDFLFGLKSGEGESPVLNIGAELLQLQQLKVGQAKAKVKDNDFSLGKIEIKGGLFSRRDNGIHAEKVQIENFSACTPQRWADALPALGRLVGHCGSVSSLSTGGDLLFGFGRGAEVHWDQLAARELMLRYRDTRWQNWRAQTLDMAGFRYVRPQKKLSWKSAGAEGFDWCPRGLRNGQSHYCARAGVLQLADPVSFDWSEKLKVDAGPARLRRTQLLDMAGPNRRPITVNAAELGALQYRASSRQLRFNSIEIDTATGCIPGRLWKKPDQCVRLAGLRLDSPQLRFASAARKIPWGFAGGALALAQFSLEREGAAPMHLRKLRWRELDLMSYGETAGGRAQGEPLSLRDFALGFFEGCVPGEWIPEKWQPLCGKAESLEGRGNFAWFSGARFNGDNAYLVLGELLAQRLRLTDSPGAKYSPGAEYGLLLENLHTGAGYFRRNADGDIPWMIADLIEAAIGAAEAAAGEEFGTEKGLLPAELAERQRLDSVQTLSNPNLYLASASLERLDGCLPQHWARLLYGGPPGAMPVCFDLLNLSQEAPLRIRWQGGVAVSAAGLTLERAGATDSEGHRVFGIAGLQLPSASVRPADSLWSLPGFALQSVFACLPGSIASTNSAPERPRCIVASGLGAHGQSGLSASTVALRALPDSEDLWHAESVAVEGMVLSGQTPELSGVSGCPSFAWGGTRLAPCYRFGRVSLKGRESIDTAAGRVTILRGLSIEGISAQQPDYPAGLPAQLLQVGNFSVAQLRLGAAEIVAQDLQMRDISSCVPAGYVERLDHCLALEQLNLSGSYYAGDRSLSLSQLQARAIDLDRTGGRELLRLESATFEQLLLAPETWGFQRFEAGKLALLKRREDAQEYHRHSWSGRWAGMEVEQLRFDRGLRHLEIARVDALRPRFILLRDHEGQYPILEELAALTGARPGSVGSGPGAGSVETKAGTRLRYRIPDLNVRHGTFSWVDRRGEYRVRLPVRAIYLTMHNLSNYRDHLPAEVLFNARPGGFGEIQLAGTVDYLEMRKWNVDLTGYIVDASLIPAAPYMADLLGYKILQGQLDALLNIRVRENQVESFADMELEKIKVRRVREDDELPVKSSFIPLGIALSLLKDGQGNVHFQMPVKGDLYDPQFSFSFIFSHLLQQAILESLFAYFTPVGLYTLAKFAWGRFRAVSFDPIVFQPGSDQLDSRALMQLSEVLSTLREHPNTRPGICGIANPRDWNALYPQGTPGLGFSGRAREDFYRHPPLPLREEFERLAQERTRRVERFLIDAGITPAELIPCAADYNGRDFSDPRVEFSN